MDEHNTPWHSRGYLPHFDGKEAIQHVTFHLADSLPQEVVRQLAAEVEAEQKNACQCGESRSQAQIERRKRVEAFLDVGYGSCVLREPQIAAMVQNALLFFDGQRYRVLAWVIMPNHVHVLFQPMEGWSVSETVASWKKFTGTRIAEYRRSRRAGAETGVPGAGAETGVPGVPEAGTRGGDPVWHREYWDRYMRDSQHLAQAIAYIERNPLKAGLVNRPEEWRWSSTAAPGNAGLRTGSVQP